MTDRQQSNSGRLGLENDSAGQDPGSLQAEELKMREALGLFSRSERPPPRPQTEQPRPANERISGDRQSSNGHSNSHRHRFVQDGEVPVVLAKHGGSGAAPGVPRGGINAPASPTNRLAALSADLGMERAARERAEKTLQQALAMVRDLQTKIAHAELAKTEALNAARADHEAMVAMRLTLREKAEQAAADLSTERAARVAAEARLESALESAQRRRREAAVAPAMGTDETPKRKVGRPRSTEPKPPKPPKQPRAAREPKPVRWWIKR